MRALHHQVILPRNSSGWRIKISPRSELNENNRTSEINDAAEPSDDGEGDVEIGDENIYAISSLTARVAGLTSSDL